MDQETNRSRPLIWLSYLIVYLFWGSTYLAMRIGVQDMPPFILGGLRHLSAGAIMTLLALARRERFPRTGRSTST